MGPKAALPLPAPCRSRCGVRGGRRGRWAWFAPIEDEFVWDLVRSHEPVLADGVTPYAIGLKLDGFQHVGVTFGLKYRF